MIKLSEDKQKEILKYLQRCVSGAYSQRRKLVDDKIPEWWSRYRGDYSSKKDKNFPFENAADFHIPFTAWASVATESRMLNAEFGADEVALLVSEKEEHHDRVARIQKHMEYEMFKKMDFEDVERYGTQRQVVEGVRIDKIVYEKDKRILKKYDYNKKLKTYVTDFVENVINGVKKILPTGKIKIQDNEKIVYEGNKDYVVPLSDFVKWGGDDVQTCDGVAQRMHMNIRQIIDKTKTDGWINIEKLKNKFTSNDREQDIGDAREAAGLERVANQEYNYTLWEVWTYYDIDGDGNVENCMFIVDLNNNVLLYACENGNFWGDRPFYTTPLYSMANLPMGGQGLPQRLSISNDELDTLHNQVIDNSTIINAQSVTWIPKLMWKTPSQLTLRPGRAIAVKSHDAIRPIELARQAVDLNYQEQFVKDILERLAIVTDYSLGREANIERPTAKGKAMSLQEYAVNFDILLRSSRTGLKKRIRAMLRNTYQYMPPDGIEFPVIDKNGQYMRGQDNKIIREHVTREDYEIIDDIDIQVSMSAINAIKGLAQQNAAVMYQTLYPQAMQTGEVSSYGLAENFVKSIDKRVVEKIIRDPKEIQQLRRIEQMQQELGAKSEELAMRERGLLAEKNNVEIEKAILRGDIDGKGRQVKKSER